MKISIEINPCSLTNCDEECKWFDDVSCKYVYCTLFNVILRYNENSTMNRYSKFTRCEECQNLGFDEE